MMKIYGLSKKQLAALGAEANAAFSCVDAREKERIAGELANARGKEDPFACPALISKTTLFNEWRRREIARALRFKDMGTQNAMSFKELTQEDFNDVLAHFKSISGDIEGALFARFNDEGNDCRQILANIEKSCKERELLFPNYPEAICLRQYRCKLNAASLQQLRRILFTVRSRRRKTQNSTFSKKRYDHSRKHLN